MEQDVTSPQFVTITEYQFQNEALKDWYSKISTEDLESITTDVDAMEGMVVRKSKIGGYGLFWCGAEAIQKNSFVGIYLGIFHTNSTIPSKYSMYVRPPFSKEDKVFIDAAEKGNTLRFANHSCEPNCDIVELSCNGQFAVAYMSRKTIAIKEEITVDYGWSWEPGMQLTPCLCGSAICRKVLETCLARSEDKKEEYDKLLKKRICLLFCLLIFLVQSTAENKNSSSLPIPTVSLDTAVNTTIGATTSTSTSVPTSTSSTSTTSVPTSTSSTSNPVARRTFRDKGSLPNPTTLKKYYSPRQAVQPLDVLKMSKETTTYHAFVPSKGKVAITTGDFATLDNRSNQKKVDKKWYVYKVISVFRDNIKKQLLALLQWHRPAKSLRLQQVADLFLGKNSIEGFVPTNLCVLESLKDVQYLPKSISKVEVSSVFKDRLFVEDDCNFFVQPSLHFEVTSLVSHVLHNRSLPDLESKVGWTEAGLKYFDEMAESELLLNVTFDKSDEIFVSEEEDVHGEQINHTAEVKHQHKRTTKKKESVKRPHHDSSEEDTSLQMKKKRSRKENKGTSKPGNKEMFAVLDSEEEAEQTQTSSPPAGFTPHSPPTATIHSTPATVSPKVTKTPEKPTTAAPAGTKMIEMMFNCGIQYPEEFKDWVRAMPNIENYSHMVKMMCESVCMNLRNKWKEHIEQ